jgi:hypothetical protein
MEKIMDIVVWWVLDYKLSDYNDVFSLERWWGRRVSLVEI